MICVRSAPMPKKTVSYSLNGTPKRTATPARLRPRRSLLKVSLRLTRSSPAVIYATTILRTLPGESVLAVRSINGSKCSVKTQCAR